MKIFLSSTYTDLPQHRRCVIEALDRLRHSGAGLEWLGMEAFGARPDLPVETCLKFVDRCTLYVGIFGVRYGTIDKESGFSITEMEYRRAVEKRKPRLIFLIDEQNAKVAPRDIEPSSRGRTKLEKFKSELRANQVVDFFSTPEDLASKVATAVLLHSNKVSDDVMRESRLKDLGIIAAGVAHEMRNPLASIRTFAQLLPEKANDAEFVAGFSKLVIKDVDHITMVIESMLTFAQPLQMTVDTCAASDVVDEALLLMQALLQRKHIRVVKDYQKRVFVKINKQQVIQVLVNLISNAADAVADGGEIKITISERPIDSSEVKKRERLFASIEVADDGVGIPLSAQPHLFVPFFTAKKNHTGLGLSVSQKIVRDHGGIITYSTTEGKGSSFQINLPQIQLPSSRSPE